MNIIAKAVFAGAFVAAMSMMGGCDSFGSGPTITINYDHPAEITIPDKVKNLAIQEFSGSTPEDARWGQTASDKTASRLDEANRQYDRYRLVDRNKLKTILAEKDLQLAFGSPEEASKHAGKLSAVDAIIYGNVKVSSHQVDFTKPSIDFASQRPTMVHATKTVSTATVSFNMVDVGTGKSYINWTSPQQTFDSEKDSKKSLGSMFQGSSDTSETALNMLVDRCVDQFVAKISPTQVSFTEKLSKSKSPAVLTGNRLAAAGSYDEALKNFLQAYNEDPEDDAAAFNAGLMYEATKNMAKALEFYTKAVSLKDDKRYIRARARAAEAAKVPFDKMVGANIGGGAVAPAAEAAKAQ